MLDELKKEVCKANKRLKESGLVILTWGNVSAIDRKQGLIVIKPSGVPYERLTPDKMTVVDLDGNIVEGELLPSADTPTHIALYRSFEEIGSVVHTNSRFASIWAQAGLDITAYGTMHADHFNGDIPCTLPLEDEQIENDYEKNVGFLIADTFARRDIDPMEVPACLVASSSPFIWGINCEKAVDNAIVLEEAAHMAVYNMNFQFGLPRISQTLLEKHYSRKNGVNAYYGQLSEAVTEVTPAPENEEEFFDEDIQILPNESLVKLSGSSLIAEAEVPAVHRLQPAASSPETAPTAEIKPHHTAQPAETALQNTVPKKTSAVSHSGTSQHDKDISVRENVHISKPVEIRPASNRPPKSDDRVFEPDDDIFSNDPLDFTF